MKRMLLLVVAGLVVGCLGCSSSPLRRVDTPPLFGSTQPAATPIVPVVPASYSTRMSAFEVNKDCKT